MLWGGAAALPLLCQICFRGYFYVQLFQPPLLLLRVLLRLFLGERRRRHPSLLPRPSRVGYLFRGQLPGLCGHAGLYDPGLCQSAGRRGAGRRLLLCLQPGLNAPAALRRRTYRHGIPLKPAPVSAGAGFYFLFLIKKGCSEEHPFGTVKVHFCLSMRSSTRAACSRVRAVRGAVPSNSPLVLAAFQASSAHALTG